MPDFIFYIIIGLTIGLVGGFFIAKFIQVPTSTKIEMLKKWLLWAVAQAEAEMGAGTGSLKLAKVYNKFVEDLPQIASVITYDQFCDLVDESLKILRNLIETNGNIDDFINMGVKEV